MSSYNGITFGPTAHASPAEQQWNDHRETIRHLYIVQDTPLRILMTTMREVYGFNATVKMYKGHLAKWQFTKNNNLKHMQIVARRIIRENVSEAQRVYEVNGRSVTVEEVTRYFRRKGYKRLIDAIEYGNSSSRVSYAENGDGSDVTPAAHGDVQQTSQQHRVLLDKRQEVISAALTREVSEGLLPSPNAHTNFTSADELVLKMVEVYYTGCCETDLWYTCTAGRFRTRRPVDDAATVVDRFVGFWTIGLDFALKGNMMKCYGALSQACGKLPRIVQAEHPTTIRALLEMILDYSKVGLGALALPVLREILRTNPPWHPLVVICRQILRVEPSTVENMAVAALACATDTLAKQCGEYHYCVLRCRTALIKSRSTYLDELQIAELADRLLAGFVQSSHFSVEGCLNLCESLLEYLYESQPLERTEGMIGRMERWASDLSPERARKWTVSCTYLLSQAQFRHGKFELAEQNCRWCIQQRMIDFGADDSRTRACISRLSDWLIMWNQSDEALEIEAFV
jgi:Clr5 domain